MPIIVSASYFSKTQNYYQLAEVVYYPDALVLASEDIAKIRLEFPYSEPEFPGNYCKELLRLVDVLVPYIDENSR